MLFFLLPIGTNIPLVVKATARLVLMLACDVVQILTRAFREAAVNSITKPERRDGKRGRGIPPTLSPSASSCKERTQQRAQMLLNWSS